MSWYIELFRKLVKLVPEFRVDVFLCMFSVKDQKNRIKLLERTYKIGLLTDWLID